MKWAQPSSPNLKPIRPPRPEPQDRCRRQASAPATAPIARPGKPFTGFSSQAISVDEIGFYPQHGPALAFEDGDTFNFKTPVAGIESTVSSGVVSWLRACARRNGIGIEPGEK